MRKAVNDNLMWADGQVVNKHYNDKVNSYKTSFGPEPSKAEKKKGRKTVQTEEVKEDFDPNDTLDKLVARDMASLVNTPELIKKHLEFTKGKIFTRFPPEPNGYLHIGHAKAVRFSFKTAADNGGSCYLRYDDTNPEKECQEYIDAIKDTVVWLGYQPWKTTYSSDYFDELYELAIELIKRGKAYVCHLPMMEAREQRRAGVDGPYRNRSIEENLDLFEQMKMGMFEEGECCLRMKIDMQHKNTVMRDPAAYRIKFTAHPHGGDKWCIYPTYDYTHCIVDSLENITHSLCTLEFEIRRDSYYWLLEALDLYRPYVWEYSRLNISNSILSKRKIDDMVKAGIVESWSDPRLLTLFGLKRRGYTPTAINKFVDSIGVARKGNSNMLSIKLLEFFIREELNETAPRTLCVLDPLKLVFTDIGADEHKTFEGAVFPGKDGSEMNTYTLTQTVYIEKDDFKEVHVKGFYGLCPGQKVILKDAGYIELEEIVKGPNGEVDYIKVKHLGAEIGEKVKGCLHWVSDAHKQKVVVRNYDYLFLDEKIGSFPDWLKRVNPNSLTVYENALLWDFHTDLKPYDQFQFQRLGYFTVADDTKEGGPIYINRTVSLVESKAKRENMGKKK